MKNIVHYIDQWRMVVNLFDRDGGDSCAHGCCILYAASVTKDDTHVLTAYDYVHRLESPDNRLAGRFKRHPDPTKWYSKLDTFSRDQFIGLLALITMKKMRRVRNALFLQHLKRGLLFFWNTHKNGSYPGEPAYKWKLPDIANPAIWGMWIRAFRCWPLYPVLIGLDFYNLLSSILYRTKIVKSTLQMNHIILVDSSVRFMPTPVSYLSRLIYGKTTPIEALEASWGPDWQAPVDVYLTNLVKTW